MTTLTHIREGIGATRCLDHGPALDDECTRRRRQGGKPGAPARQASLPRGEVFPGWSDHELGMVARMAAERCTPGAIADEIISRSVSAQQVGALLDKLQACLIDRPRKSPARKPQRSANGPSGRPPHRPRSITPDQERQILELRGKGLTMAEIAKASGISEGRVRYVLSPQWGEP